MDTKTNENNLLLTNRTHYLHKKNYRLNCYVQKQ